MLLIKKVLFLFVLSNLIFGLSFAQIGEVAGPVNFNVSVGSTQSLIVTIVDGGNTPIMFNATPLITTVIKNATAPIMKVYPQNGTIQPHSQVALNLTAYVPGGDKPGMFWNGQLSVISNSSTKINGSGAIIHEGTLKIFTVTAAQQKFDIFLYVGIVVLIVILIVAVYFYKKMKRLKHNTRANKAKR